MMKKTLFGGVNSEHGWFLCVKRIINSVDIAKTPVRLWEPFFTCGVVTVSWVLRNLGTLWWNSTDVSDFHAGYFYSIRWRVFSHPLIGYLYMSLILFNQTTVDALQYALSTVQFLKIFNNIKTISLSVRSLQTAVCVSYNNALALSNHVPYEEEDESGIVNSPSA